MNRRLARWWGLPALAVLLVMSLLVINVDGLSGEGPMARLFGTGFNDELWRAQHRNTSHKNPRIGLVPSLDKVLAPGMSREEVIAVLGPPEANADGRDLYSLGASPYGVDYEQLVVEYDADDRLERYYVVRG